MHKFTIQLTEHIGNAERIWTHDVKYTTYGIEFYEKDKPNFMIFIPYTSIRMITRDDR